MPSLPIRIMLFISSYFPLALIFGIFLLDKEQPWTIGEHPWALISLLIGLTGLLCLYLYFHWIAPRRPVFHERIATLERRDGDVMSYIASYLIPFVAFPLGGWQQVAAILVFLAVLMVIYVNSNMIYINPMLNLFGYHLYEVTLEQNESSFYLISRHRVARNEMVGFVKIGDTALLEVKAKTI
jgi:hypothetical protein